MSSEDDEGEDDVLLELCSELKKIQKVQKSMAAYQRILELAVDLNIWFSVSFAPDPSRFLEN